MGYSAGGNVTMTGGATTGALGDGGSVEFLGGDAQTGTGGHVVLRSGESMRGEAVESSSRRATVPSVALGTSSSPSALASVASEALSISEVVAVAPPVAALLISILVQEVSLLAATSMSAPPTRVCPASVAM